MRDAIKNINAEKIKTKEKRRKIDEQFKEQKVSYCEDYQILQSFSYTFLAPLLHKKCMLAKLKKGILSAQK